MEEEKNLQPTAKKLRDARKKGQVAKSGELATAVLLVGGVCLIRGFARLLDGGFKEVMVSQFTSLDSEQLCASLGRAFLPLLFPVISIMAGLMFIAIAVHVLQVGWIWARPKRGKKSHRFFYLLAKLVVVAAVGSLLIRSFRSAAIDSIFFTPLQKERLFFQKTFTLALGVSLAILLLSVADFFYQKWHFKQKMMMTKEEMKQEKRETEGNSRAKAEIRARHQDLK